MAGGLFARLKTWIAGETLTAADLNGEINNIKDNLLPAKFDDFSVNVAQMKTTFDPGEVGTENLPTDLSEEIGALRQLIGELSGKDEWYESPAASIDTIVGLIGGAVVDNRIVSGLAEANSSLGVFLEAAGSSAQIDLKGSVTDFVYRIAGTEYTINSDVNVSSLVTAPSTNNTCLVDDATMVDQQASEVQGEDREEGSTEITIGTIGSEITALNGDIAAFKKGSEYFLAKVDTTNTRLLKCFRGYFFDSNSAAVPRETLADTDVLTLMKLTWIFAKADGTLAVTYNNLRAGGSEPSGPATGDYWFDTDNGIWKTFNSTVWVDATATFVGICIQDDTNCVAARSLDFFKAYAPTNTIELDWISVTEVRSKIIDGRVSVYGTTVDFIRDYARWDMASDLDGGVSEGASTIYFMYVKEDGNITISDVYPHNRKNDLQGQYHPHHAWRCVGQITNDSGSDLDANTIIDSDYELVTRERMENTGEQISSSSGAYTNATGADDDVTNLTATITVKKNPVVLMLVPDGSTNVSYVGMFENAGDHASIEIYLDRDGSKVGYIELETFPDGSTQVRLQVSPSSITFFDTPIAGEHVYKIICKDTLGTAIFNYCKLVAYEL